MKKWTYMYAVLLALFLLVPFLAWMSMSRNQETAQSVYSRLEQTRRSVTEIINAASPESVDTSGSFGQAEAVRIVNSVLIEAGLSPSGASELALRDDPIKRQGQEAGRLQRLTIRLRPIELFQLGRLLAGLEDALPSFSAAEIGLQRPGGLDESDTRFGVDLALEREYIANTEVSAP